MGAIADRFIQEGIMKDKIEIIKEFLSMGLSSEQIAKGTKTTVDFVESFRNPQPTD